MKKVTRRSFLKGAGAGMAGLASVMVLGACSSSEDETTAEETESLADAETAAETEAQTEAQTEAEASEDQTLQLFYSDDYLRDSVTIAISSDGGNFNPVNNAGGFGKADMCVHMTLAVMDSEGGVRLQLLKSFDEVDELTYNGELWDFIYDTAGSNLKASDVAYAIDQKIATGDAGAINRLDYLEVTGDYTFVWHCSAPFDLGEMGKNLSNVEVYSQESYENSDDGFARKPEGVGPYEVTEYVSGSKVILTAVDDWWMKNIDDEEWLEKNLYYQDFQNVRTVDLEIIQDASSRAVALERGDVDVCDSMNAADVEQYIANPDKGISAVLLPVTSPVSFYFNCNEISPCSDINLRKSICYSFDNAEVAAGCSYPSTAIYGLQPNLYDAPESWTTGEGIDDYYEYDFDKAQELLDESSYNGETLSILYGTAAGATSDAVIMVQSALTSLGIKTNLTQAERSIVNEYAADPTKWDIRFDTVGGGNYLKNVLKTYTTEEGGPSHNGMQVMLINDDHLDELFNDLDADTNDETIEAWHQYFVYDQCYGYSICVYSDQTACLNDVNCVINVASNNRLIPGAFTFND